MTEKKKSQSELTGLGLGNLVLLLLCLLVVLALTVGLSVAELWVLKNLGFDVLADISASWGQEPEAVFFLKAAGFSGFLLVQQIVLVVLLVWAALKLGPVFIIREVQQLIQSILD